MKIHPLAELFPMHDGDELQSLAADIKAKGLQEKIWLYEGKILDGRRRHAGCKIAKVQPEFQEYEGDDPLAFVLSKNLHRRHLNASERAMVAAEIANLERGNPKQNAYNGSKEPLSVSTETAAEMLNVSVPSVKRAKKVKADADESVVDAVKTGGASVTDAASVADEPKDVQKKAACKVKAGEAATLREGVAKVKEEQEIPRDKVSSPIPEKAIPAFGTGREINSLCLDLDKIIARVKELAGKPGGRLVHCDSITQQIRQSRQALYRAIPTHVCPYCQGDKPSCNACKGEGWTNQTYFEQAPAEKRAAMKERGNINVPF